MNESFDDFLKDLSDREQPDVCDINNQEDCDSCGSQNPRTKTKVR